MAKKGFNRATNAVGDVWAGRRLATRAAAHGIYMRGDDGIEVLAAEAYFRGKNVAQDPDDANIAIIEDASGVRSMLNNSGDDLPIYSVVVTDPTEDDAFTTTTTAQVSDRGVGVIQAPILAGETGPVMFSGVTQVGVDGAVTRGDFLETSTTAGAAATNPDRREGSFGVLLEGADPADATSSDWRVWRESWDGGSIGGTPASWETLGFDDSGWFAPHDLGVASLGGHIITPEEAFAGTTLKTLHWLARSPEFTLDGLPTTPVLEVAHDDGIAVYLNGVLVHSNASLATDSVSLSPSAFIVGANVLAIRLTNTATSNVWAVNPTDLALRLHDGDQDLCVIGQPFIEVSLPLALIDGALPDLIDPASIVPLTVEDESTPLATAADTLNFVGAGVTATGSGGTKTITIPGGASDLGWFNILDYGAVCDGTTDDYAAWAAAIVAAGVAGGGIVYHPGGISAIGTALALTSANVVLLGAGANASQIKALPGLATGDMVDISAIRCGVRDLNLYSASQKTGGIGIYLSGASDATIERVNLQNQYDSIKVNGGSVIRIAGCNLYDQKRHGIWVTGVGNDLYLSRIVADNSPTSTGNGIYLDSGFQAIIGENCDFLHFTRGLFMSPSATSTWHFFTGMIFDTNSSNGIELGGGAGLLYGVTFVNCWAASNTNQGVYIGSNVEGVQWIAGKVLKNGQHGFDLTGSCSRIKIDGNLIVSNSQGSSNTYSGIRVDAGCTHISIIGNHANNGLGLGSTQKYGLTFDTGATDYLVIDDNDFSSNVTGEIGNLAGVSGTHAFIGGSASMTGRAATTYLDGTGAYSTPPGTGPAFATPSIGYGTPAGGAASTVIRSDATIAKPTAPDVDFSADVTNNNVTSGHHGLAPKNDGNAAHYLDGTGAYSTPAGTAPTEAQIYGVGGHWELLMDPATSSPPVPLTTPDGTDWVYGWISDGG